MCSEGNTSEEAKRKRRNINTLHSDLLSVVLDGIISERLEVEKRIKGSIRALYRGWED